MRKITTIIALTYLVAASPCFGQGFLDRLSKSIDKATEKIDKLGKPEQAKQSTEQPATKGVLNPYYPHIKSLNDLTRLNIKGTAIRITETEVEKEVENLYEYNYNGFLERFVCQDKKGSTEYSYSGTIEFKYEEPERDNYVVSNRKMSLKNYLTFDGKTYNKPEDVEYSYNNGRVDSQYDNLSGNVTTYSYDAQGRKVKSATSRYAVDILTELFVYDANGRLIEVHSDKITQDPMQRYAYDSQGRVILSETSIDKTEYTYNPKGDIATKKYQSKDDADDKNSSSFEYQYDENGNWTKRVEKTASGDVVTTTIRAIGYILLK